MIKDSNIIDVLFRVGMWWRIFYGFLRLILGFVLLRLVGTPLSDIFYRFMAHEIVEDPTDFFIHTINQILQHSPLTVTYFLASYLLFWGVIDVGLSVSLLKHKIWAFPLSIYLIVVFVTYEIYRFTHTHSLVLLGIIILDIGLIWLIRKEYRKLKVLNMI